MDFQLTEEQRMVRDMVRDFAQQENLVHLERWRPDARETDWRPSDQYAAAVCAYEVLSQGTQPLDFGTAILERNWSAVEQTHLHGPRQPLRVPERSEGRAPTACVAVDEVLARMMASDPSRRYGDIRDAYLALQTALAHDQLKVEET